MGKPIFRSVCRALAGLVLAGAAATVVFGNVAAGPAGAEFTPAGVEYHPITFPVAAPVAYRDDFGECRAGCTRRHQGIDLPDPKLTREVAAANGTITYIGADRGAASGNMLTLQGDDGWSYKYMHVNDDTPGTNDDSNPPAWMFAPGLHVGSRVTPGQFLAYMGDSGDATGPHLHFEIHRPDGTAIDGYPSLQFSQQTAQQTAANCGKPSNPRSKPNATAGTGYWVLSADGAVYAFGKAPFYGRAAAPAPNAPYVGLAATPTGHGYWIVDARGAVRGFGDAKAFGPRAGTRFRTRIVGMTPTPSGHGYWLVGADGGVFSFGDAAFHGAATAHRLRGPVVAMATTSTGRGYWLLGADGGVFSFGDAAFRGSASAHRLHAPVIAMASTATGKGYWLLGADGGVFTFGDATFHGSIPGFGVCGAPVSRAVTHTRTGRGYWLLLDGGHVIPFGDAKSYGDAARFGANAVAVTAAL
jgi:Peptidase family M23